MKNTFENITNKLNNTEISISELKYLIELFENNKEEITEKIEKNSLNHKITMGVFLLFTLIGITNYYYFIASAITIIIIGIIGNKIANSKKDLFFNNILLGLMYEDKEEKIQKEFGN